MVFGKFKSDFYCNYNVVILCALKPTEVSPVIIIKFQLNIYKYEDITL